MSELVKIMSYLPYRLKMISTNDFVSPLIRELRVDGFQFMINTRKPILRPLSDLSKEINHISYTKQLEPDLENIIPNDLFKKHWWISIREDGHFSTDHGDGTCTGYSYKSAPYDIILLLLEWNFDIFGLIKNGSAIDINTIKELTHQKIN